MTLPEVDSDLVAARLSLIRPHLDERAWRLLLGAEAKVLGRGGIKVVAAAVGCIRTRWRRVCGSWTTPDRFRGGCAGPVPGARRWRLTDPDSGRRAGRVGGSGDSRGDPESPLRWTTKSTAKLAGELTAMGHRVSASTVGKLLKQRVQPAGELENHRRRPASGSGCAVRLSQHQVDRVPGRRGPGDQRGHQEEGTVGNFKAAAANGSPPGHRATVKVHDFADKQLGKVAPYGVYDIAANTGWVNVGTDADTGAVRGGIDPPLVDHHGRRQLSRIGQVADHRRLRWLQRIPAAAVENRTRRLRRRDRTRRSPSATCRPAPANGTRSNTGCSPRSAATGADDPWTSHEVVIETIRATTTTTGLTVNAELDLSTYDRGIKITDKQIADLEATQLHRHEFHGDWNYTLTADHTATRPTEPIS